jgi:hypothetical protein
LFQDEVRIGGGVMAWVISIEELEAIINKVRRAFPPVQGKLSPPLCILAEVYGVMIYDRARSIDIDGLTEETKLVLRDWLSEPVAATHSETGNGAACMSTGSTGSTL